MHYPLIFVLYTADVTQIATQFDESVHCYANDFQLSVHCSVSDVNNAVRCIKDCITSIDRWMSSNRLKLNPNKIQFTWLGTGQQLRRFNPPSMRMPSGLIIEPTSVVHILGVFLDTHLSMGSHFDWLVKTCMHQLRQLRALRQSLSTDAVSILVHAFISSRLDYFNSIFNGISDKQHRKLQFIQNSTARLIIGHHLSDHITPVLRDQLHWLPERQRIQHKLTVLVQRCLSGSASSYFCEMLIPTGSLQQFQQLRSSAHCELYLNNRQRLCLSTRSFHCAGPDARNSLPVHLRDLTISSDCFKTLLKTHLFNIVYST